MNWSRRGLLAAGGAALAAGIPGCAGTPGGGDTTTTTAGATPLHTIETEGSISDIVFEYGLDRGVWEARGIDLDFEVGAFGKYNRQVVTGASQIGAPSTVAQLKFVDKGEDLTFVGQQLNMFNRMFARADDDSIADPADLAGKRVGLPASKTSTTSTTHRVLVRDEYGVDLLDDPAETRAAPPAALWEFLQDGELDAISEFSGFTIKGMASDAVKTIFDPYEYWTERTGTGLPTTTFTVARDWLSGNAATVEDFLAGWQDAVAALESNPEEALDRYGDVAGVTTDEEATVVGDLIDEDVLFGPAYFDADLVDANWEFVSLLVENDVLGSRPDRDRVFTTRDELGALQG